MSWIPPKSPYNLVQRQFYDNPWRLLVACVFCNLTKRNTAEPYMWKFFERWPTPEAVAHADEEEIVNLIRDLGLYRRRAKALKKMSAQFLEMDWKEPKELYGIGKYANDAWHIFCVGNWESIKPKDHALTAYHNWLRESYARDSVAA